MSKFLYTIFLLAIVLVGPYGWIMNIVKIVHSHDVDGMLVARVVGVFMAPLGVVLGYF